MAQIANRIDYGIIDHSHQCPKLLHVRRYPDMYLRRFYFTVPHSVNILVLVYISWGVDNDISITVVLYQRKQYSTVHVQATSNIF